MSRRLRKLSLFGGILFTAAALSAQEGSLQNILPGLRDRAVVLDITARIVEPNHEEVWNSSNSKVTIPGRPVSLKLVGENVVVAVQFTPYLRSGGHNVLLAQGQIWVDIPNVGIRYQSTMQTIPLEYGESIYFFPLGTVKSGDTAHIEIQLALYPYAEEAPPPANPELPAADRDTLPR
jgi:hypothetical protein